MILAACKYLLFHLTIRKTEEGNSDDMESGGGSTVRSTTSLIGGSGIT